MSQDTVTDHDYMCTMWKLSPYVEDTLKYISGFVSKAVKKLIHCEFCVQLLFDCEDICVLSCIKNRGGLNNFIAECSINLPNMGDALSINRR